MKPVENDKSEKMMAQEFFAPQNVECETRVDGSIIVKSKLECGDVAGSTGEWLDEWSKKRPEQTFLAEREGEGWRKVSYAQAYDLVRKIATSLLTRDLGYNRPIALLSCNGIDHALLTLAAQYVGIPTTPVSEAYSLIPDAHHRLQHILGLTNPGLVFAADATKFAGALALNDFENVEIIASKIEGTPRPVTPFQSLLKNLDDKAVDAANKTVGPDTIAKYLFTSGSTSQPKGVVTTQRMMCVNQAQILASWPFLRHHPPRLVCWLPWNHVAGGSNNFNVVLSNGGTMYIDEGRPTDAGFPTSIRNMREIGCTITFNVPIGYAKLADEMETDSELREAFFADLDMIQYAGASLPAEVWDKLCRLSIETRGFKPRMVSGWGMTETAPAALSVHEDIDETAIVGVPLPELTMKLIPDDDMRCEIRVKGPNVMTSYLNDPEKTKSAFDDEGFLITGDAVRFVDLEDPSRGFRFDGRISEDFKLLTGTWVQVATLRLAVLEALSPYVAEAAVTGNDRYEIGILIVPSQAAKDMMGDRFVDDDGAIVCADIQAALKVKLQEFAQNATGSSTRVSRALVMSDPPLLGRGEMTDKGNMNRNRLLSIRAELVKRLYNDDDEAVILAGGKN